MTKDKPAIVNLGSTSFAILAGKSGMIDVPLTHAALKLLRKRGRLKAVVTAVATDGFGRSHTTTASITLRMRKRK